jgi:inositol phosphorylceramide mannosyltransferase catalytic subunit
MSITYTASGIPRIIHQTWKDRNIPEKWRKSHTEWQRLHPDWVYILWTDEDIRNHIEQHHPELLAVHDNYEYAIQRADMIRYVVLHDFGGVYSDLDLYPVTNIEPLLTGCSDTYFVYSANTDCFTNALMVSRRGAPLWLEVLSRLHEALPWWAVGKHLKVMKSTGPLMLTEALRNTRTVYAVLPQTIFNPYSVADDFGAEKQGVAIRTLEGSSWHAWDSSLYNFAFKHRVGLSILVAVAVLVIIVCLVYYVRKYRQCRSSKGCAL